jgi:predicted polyphosphate/ATP-dependent NAD kinase
VLEKDVFKIGFLVNPIAGMGGAVALHGTDAENFRAALDLGAKPVSHTRAARALNGYKNLTSQKGSFRKIHFLTAPGCMGGDLLNELGINFTAVVGAKSEMTNSQETKNLIDSFAAIGVDAILFAGGDGTARDIFSVVGSRVPLLGIPAGVKMRSSIFTHFPEEMSQVLRDIEYLPEVTHIYREILDSKWSNPESNDYSNSTYFGVADSIKTRVAFSGSKARSSEDIDSGIQELAEILAREIKAKPGLVLIGSGTSTYAIKKVLDYQSSLQGVDAFVSGNCIGRDLAESEILRLLSIHESAELITGVIGGQGFLFGRGNQQISAMVINKISWSRVTVIAAESKLLGLFPVELYVDFAEFPTCSQMPRFVRVRTAPSKDMLVRLRSSSQKVLESRDFVGHVQQLVRSSNDR